ncbi:MAG: hypothetical protein KDA53_02400 [Hyphomonas sp.]|nr:hypothetical protein [Hyphomonas sp.]
MALSQIADHVAGWIEASIRAAAPGHVPLLFMSGPQGSGKSTALAAAIEALDESVVGTGLDDFYLRHAERMELARKVSPLFLTRGPPGTHDLLLLGQTVAALRGAGPEDVTPLPVFDKLKDDRAPVPKWREFTGRPRAIVIEGWLMGATPDPDSPMSEPLNPTEATDRTGHWRQHQEDALAEGYARLWDLGDGLLHVIPPDFDCVRAWRLQQEESLWQDKGEPMPDDRRAWVGRFIEHYERLTRRMIAGQRRPGAEVYVAADRSVIRTSGC